MTRERIISTLPGGKVAVTCPAEQAIWCLRHGAKDFNNPWFGRPWYFPHLQFARMVARGVKPSVAWAYSTHMMRGGLTRRQAIDLIGARDCPGVCPEIVDVSELPDSRFYRDAWRRSSNGGPVWIDDEHKEQIETNRMWGHYETRTA